MLAGVTRQGVLRIPVFPPGPRGGLLKHATTPSSYVGVGDPISGLHASSANSLPSKPSPQLLSLGILRWLRAKLLPPRPGLDLLFGEGCMGGRVTEC